MGWLGALYLLICWEALYSLMVSQAVMGSQVDLKIPEEPAAGMSGK